MYLKFFIKKRKIIILCLISEFLIFNFFNFLNPLPVQSIVESNINFIVYFLISYVIGKYELNFPKNYISAIKFLYKYTLVFLLNYIYKLLFLFSYLNLGNLKTFSIFYLKLIFVSSLIQLIIISFFKNKDKSLNWIAFIDEDEKNLLDIFLREYNMFNARKINLFYFRDCDINSLKRIDGLILEKKIILKNKSLINKIKRENRGINLVDTVQWCNYYLEFLPISLLSKDSIKNRILNQPLRKFYGYLKFIGDVTVSFSLIILTSPLMLIIAILIKLEDGGPIFYTQKRTGFNLKTFEIYKFRSMKVDAENTGIQWSSKTDSRITRIGKFIRLMRLDELPQLILVMKGQMSLIGPRPERPEINKFLFKETEFYSYRYLIKPGLSGWAQVNYNYAASKEESINKLAYDMYYLKNCSFLLDLLILFKTIKIVFNLKGALPN